MAVDLEILVVDNASTDRTVERASAHTGVRVIANRENRGFAAAANEGFRSTGAELVLLLNPDVTLRTPVDSLMRACRESGLAAGKLADKQGRAQAGFTIRRFPTSGTLILEILGINRIWPRNPINRRYRYLDLDLEQAGPVEQPAGAFLMIRRDVWSRLGGFDEGFHPIWFEDVDFCRRAALAGYEIQYVPSAWADHAGGHSVAQISEGCRAQYWYGSLLKYAAKHFGSIGYRGVCAAVVLGSFPRMVAGMILQRSLAPIAVFSKIIRFSGLCLVSSRRRGIGELPNS
jgi:N-acetylglucosaminyl-diphospho-decaprenol L-rhamnosyltransferase